MDELVGRSVDVDLRGARGVIVGDDATMHLYPPGQRPSWWTRSGYIDQVRDIAPGGGAVGALRDRDAELSELTTFCAGDGTYLWWIAGPWAGKSALLSTFVLRPPPEVEVVSFFITARLADQSGSPAFTDMLIDQLSAILGETVPGSLNPARADTYRRALLTAAAKKVQDEGRRLVLVVDGLDEDRGNKPGSEIPSVASLLPRVCDNGLQVVVSSRPDPELPRDLPSDHPLRVNCQVRELATSPHASEFAERANQELLVLLEGNKLQRHAIGLIAACGGGLTLGELEELTRKPPYMLEKLLHGVFGRTVVGRADADQRRLYLFAHETLRESAVQSLGAGLKTYRKRIHDWADRYRPEWPPDTPQYLLRGYVRMLTDQADADRLAALATDPVRHDRMLNLSGGDFAALSEIRACQSLILAKEETADTDLYCLLRLAHHRDQLESRNSNTPAGLPAVWAVLGQPTRAEALARSITDPSRQERALAGVAGAAACTGDLQRAADIAAGINDLSLRAATLTDVVRVAAVAGDVKWAADTAAGIDPPLSERTATLLARAAAASGDLRLAQLIAGRIAEPQGRSGALTALVTDAAGLGDPARAVVLAEAAERAAADILELPIRARYLIELMDALRRADEAHRVLVLADTAEDAARGILERPDRWEVQAELARAVAAAGDVERATRIAAQLDDEFLRVKALAALPGASVGAHRTVVASASEAAVQLAGDVSDLNVRRRALAMAGRPPVAASGDVRHPPDDRAAMRTVAEAVQIVLEPVTALAEAAVRFADSALDPAQRAAGVHHSGPRLAEACHVVERQHVMQLSEAAQGAAYSANDPSRQAQTLADLVRAALGPELFRQARRLARAAIRAVETAADREADQDGFEEQALALRDMAAAVHAACASWRPADLVIAVERGAGRRNSLDRAQTLTAVAQAVVGKNDRQDVLTLAGAADRAACAVVDSVERARALSEVARVFAIAGDLPRGLRVAHGITEWQTRDAALAGLAHRAAVADDVDSAVRITEAMHDPSRRTQTLEALARDAATAGEHERAVRIARGFQDPSQIARILAGLARAAADEGETERAAGLADAAEKTARSIVDQLREARALTDLARATAAAGDRERAIDLAATAEETARGIADPYRQAQALAEVARALVEVGDHERAGRAALAIAQQTEQVRTVAELARTVAAIGETDLAMRLVHDVTDPYGKHETLAKLAAGLASDGDMQPAVRIASGIANPSHHASTLTELAGIAALSGDPGQATALVDATVDLAHSVTDSHVQAQMLAALAGAVAAAGDVAQAVRVAGAIASESRRTQTLQDLVRFEATAGDLEHALQIAGGIAEKSQQAQAMIDLIRLMAANGRMEHAENLARDLTDDLLRNRTLAEVASMRRWAPTLAGATEQAARSITDRHLQRHTLARLAGRIADRGDVPRALQITWRLTDPKTRGTALADVARAVADSGDIEQAADIAARIGDDPAQARELAGLVSKVASAGDIRWAARVATRIRDSARQAEELLDLIGPLVDAGDIDDACELAVGIADPHRQARALTDLAAISAGTGDVGRALRLADRISDPALRAFALTELAATGVAAFARAAEQSAASVLDPSRKALCLAHLAAQAAPGSPRHARALAISAERVAELVADQAEQAQTLIEMARIPGMPHAARLIGKALTLAPWRVSLPALATMYPHLLRRFTTPQPA
ncbi:hypothetical protein [Actinoplanes sp. GCM10030250]|uniref:hypothetical protein n=1 Tax=Actinoplanes sp. GCM10030250 TaxID=3273376 RepID=UPI0036199553